MAPHRRLFPALLAAAALLILACPAGAARTPRVPRVNRQGLVVLRSRRGFEATWGALLAALEGNANVRVIAQVDHAAAAAAAGLSLAPNRVAVFGNPALGTPVMAAARTAGLDLPQKVHVYVRCGRVLVAYNAATYLAARHGAAGVPQLATVAGALASFAAAAAGVAPSPAAPRWLRRVARYPGIATKRSASGFEKTWARLLAAVAASPAQIAFTVDHAANAEGAGASLSPTRLAVFGNPALGTPLMQASASAGIDLPLKILVWQDAHGVTQVSTNSVSFLRRRHRLWGVDASLEAARKAISNFVTAAVAA